MKPTLLLTIPIAIALAGLPGPGAAQAPPELATELTPDELAGIYSVDPYWITSRCEFNLGTTATDPSSNGNKHVCDIQTTKEACEQRSFCWWRDTDKQNALSHHTMDEFLDTVTSVATTGVMDVYVYSSPYSSSVVLLVTDRSYMLVGCGGGTNEAMYSRSRLAGKIAGKVLRGIVQSDPYPETAWGCKVWAGNAPVTLYASQLAVDAMEEQWNVDRALTERAQRAYGTFLPWGSDAFIGSGFGREFRATPPQPWLTPSVVIGARTEIALDGNVIALVPLAAPRGGLLVHVPAANTAILPTSGAYLPDAGSLVHTPPARVKDWVQDLEYLRTLGLEVLAPMHGLAIVGAANVAGALVAQRDALDWIHTETLQGINEGVPLDDLLVQIALPPDLVTARNRELTSTVPFIVRQVYQEYLGWFDGDPAKLHPIGALARAQRLIALAGGATRALSYAQKCITEHTREGAQTALEVTSALLKVQPSQEARQIYKEALRMSAFDETSAYLRNYYLSELQAAQAP